MESERNVFLTIRVNMHLPLQNIRYCNVVPKLKHLSKRFYQELLCNNNYFDYHLLQ